mgnify:CR=1 FL=1
MVEFLYIKIGNLGAFFVIRKRYNRLQASVVRHRMAIVVQAHSIIAYAIDRRYITLVLRGASCNERIPILDADVGPVGHHKDDIVVATRLVARPYRETQIVADQQEDLDTLVLKDTTLLSWLEEEILAAVGIQVAFVLYFYGRYAIGRRAAYWILGIGRYAIGRRAAYWLDHEATIG